jgi:hypothetical protein
LFHSPTLQNRTRTVQDQNKYMACLRHGAPLVRYISRAINA